MTKLLSDSDFAEIRVAINDVAETFLQKPVLYKLFQESMSRMNSDLNKNTSYAEFTLNGLVVWDEKPPLEARQGIADLTGGYVLFGIDYLKTVVANFHISVPEPHGPLEDPPEEIPEPDPDTLPKLFSPDGTLLMNEGADRMEFDGFVMLIDSIQKLGQLKDEEAVIKVFFHKELLNK